MNHIKAVLLGGVMLPLFIASSTGAQKSDDYVIDEVLVTAEKRDSSLQTTPLSVSVLSGDEMDAMGISTIEQLQFFVPGVTVTNDAMAIVNIRGIGTSAFGVGADPSSTVQNMITPDLIAAGATPTNGKDELALDGDPQQNIDTWAVSAAINWDLNNINFTEDGGDRLGLFFDPLTIVIPGAKSGGFQVGESGSFDPEFLWSSEAGIKSVLMDQRLRANIGAFYYDVTDLQVVTFVNGIGQTDNAGEATLKGFEAEFLARPSDGVDLSLSIAYLDATYDTFTQNVGGVEVDLAGNTLPNTPKWTYSAGAQHSHPVAASRNLTFCDRQDHRSGRQRQLKCKQSAHCFWRATSVWGQVQV